MSFWKLKNYVSIKRLVSRGESLVAMETLTEQVEESGQPPPPPQRNDVFLLGRWTCQLQQCLKFLKERILIFPRVITKNLFFVPKIEENLRNVERFCSQILLSPNCCREEGGLDKEECWNRFCELSLNYFRLRLYMVTVVFGEADVFDDRENLRFARSEYLRMFPKRSDGRGRSLEYLPLKAPSLDWFREGSSFGGSVFKILELSMSLLVEECVLKELDFYEIEDLGMGAGRLEKYAREDVELGSLEEKEAVVFCRELAASLLANAVEIERNFLRKQLAELQSAAGRRPNATNRPLETGVDYNS